MRRIAHFLLVAVVALTVLTACTDIKKLQDQSAQITAQVVEWDGKITETKDHVLGFQATATKLVVEIEKATDILEQAKLKKALAETKAHMDDAKQKIVKYTAQKDKAVEEVKAINDIIQQAESNPDLIASLLSKYAHFLPQPWGTAIALGGPLLLTTFFGMKHKRDKKETHRKGIAMVHNMDTVVQDPNLGETAPGKGDGKGIFNANDPKTMARLKELDRGAGVTGMTREAME